MKFLKSDRTSFEVDVFNPGPGFYSVQSAFKNKKELLQLNQNRSSTPEIHSDFSKDQRFRKEKTSNITNPGPGQYINQSSFEQQKQHYKNQQKLQSKHSESALQFNVSTIPSIPSKNQTPGYQEIGEGLLILMKEPKKTEKINEIVGPGRYNVNLEQVKPRTLGFQFAPSQEQNQEDAQLNTVQISQQQKLQQQQQIQQLKLQSLNISNEKQLDLQQQKFQISNTNSKQNKDMPQNQWAKRILMHQVTSNSNKHINKQNNPTFDKITGNEFNLELVVLRDKFKKRQEEVPPPGYYYDAEKYSSLNIKQRSENFLWKDSQEERFKVDKNQNKVGPADYNIIHIDSVKSMQTFSKADRTDNFGDVKQSKLPGPGAYNNEILQKKKNFAKQVNYPSVFGSGQNRFGSVGSIQQQNITTPGPGYYEKSIIKKQKKRNFKTIWIQQDEDEDYNNNEKFQGSASTTSKQNQLYSIKNQSVQMELVVQQNENQQQQSSSQNGQQEENEENRSSVIEQFKKIPKNQGSAIFSSKVQRFQQKKKDENKDVGPGSYNIMKDIQKDGYNVSENLIPRSERKFAQNGNANKNVPKRVGPGTYNIKIDSIKPKKIYDIKIH